MAIISTRIVGRKETFKDTMQSRLGYARAFEKNYGVRFVDLFVADIVIDMMSSDSRQPAPEGPT